MASHGVAPTRRSRTEEQKQQDLEKIKKYRDLEDQIRANVAQGRLTPDLFQLTSKLLQLNPEYYTIWNVRRRSLISGLLSRPSAGSSPSRASPTSSPSATTTRSSAASSSSSSTATPPARTSRTAGRSGTTADDAAAVTAGDTSAQAGDSHQRQENDLAVLASELVFTTPLLKAAPKCYWIWKYRLWVLHECIARLDAPSARRVWQVELDLASRMLAKDQRNFHAWGYRRKLVARLEGPELAGASMAEAEFAYTTRKIEEHLSNFSAWHNRSKLIPRLLDERGADDAARKRFLEEEISLVQDALNVGPEDQSLWFYHGFLMREITDHTGRPTITPNLTQKERETYINSEIDFIKDLLEDYADIKWLYEALLEYSLALHDLTKQKPSGDEVTEYLEWIEQLQQLDPMRKNRWDDLSRDIRGL